jgi:hypothetical protein
MTPEQKALLQLAADFLSEYSDRLSNDGCNDWKWPAFVPKPLRAAMEQIDHEMNPSGWEPWGEQAPMNWNAVDCVAAMLHEMAKP